MKCPRCHSDNTDEARFCSHCAAPMTPPDEAGPSLTRTIESPREELITGSIFAGRYRIVEELGKGGMGRVYKVIDTKVDEKVALKLIKPEIASDRNTLERFGNELKIARRMTHKNIGKMFDIHEDAATHYITMEYISGQDLKALIRQTGALTIGKAVSIAKQICAGLSEAHGLGVVHRDLKSNNIMIDRGGNAKIMDFGIARSLKSEGITKTGNVIGTPEYMPPEQAEAKGVDLRSDLYSLGVILFEMVTGRLPFVGETPLGIAMKHKGEEPQPPSLLNPRVPDGLDRLILKCLAKDKADRFGTADEILSRLDEIERDLSTTRSDQVTRKPPVEVPEGTAGKTTASSREITISMTPRRITGVAAAGIVIVALAALLLWRPWSAGSPSAAPKIADSIAIIGFENQTGDSAYDHLQRVFPNLLITDLEATGLFHVLTWERMRDISRQIGQEGDEFTDRDLGFEICRREGIEALVIGSFTKLGDMFAADVKVYDVDTKKSLSSASSRGEGEQSILLSQIDELSREIVAARGVSGGEKGEPSVTHIADVTTESLEAYNQYLQGMEYSERMYLEEASKAFEKAIALDPTFASAYLELAFMYYGLENPKGQDKALRKAMEYSDKVTEKERLNIEAAYEIMVELDIDRAVELYSSLAAKYPREKRAYFYLGTTLFFQGSFDEAIEAQQRALELDPRYPDAVNMIAYSYAEKAEFDKAVEYFERYTALAPGEANPHDSLGDVYFQMGRLEDSLKEYEEALRIKPDFGSQWKLAYVHALREEYEAALKWIEVSIEVASVPGLKALGFLWKAVYEYWLGEFEEALDELVRAEVQARSVNHELILSRIEALRGWIYYDRGEFAKSRESLRAWNAFMRSDIKQFESGYDAMYFSGLGLISLKEGRIDSAESDVGRIEALSETTRPQDEDWVAYYHDLLEAEVKLASGAPAEAVTVAERIHGLRFPRGLSPSAGAVYNMPPCKDVLARVYLAEGEVEKAIAEYRRLTVFDPAAVGRYLIHPLYHYRLGLLYEQTGRTAEAKERYERFLELWRHADPNLEAVKDARARLAAL